jgi:hypothetical protein
MVTIPRTLHALTQLHGSTGTMPKRWTHSTVRRLSGGDEMTTEMEVIRVHSRVRAAFAAAAVFTCAVAALTASTAAAAICTPMPHTAHHHYSTSTRGRREQNSASGRT